MTDFFVSSLSGASARQAVVEETDGSGWLFMTAPNGEEPVAACFLYEDLEVTEDDVGIVWSPKGDAVAVRIHGKFIGFIGPDDMRGYSRSVTEDCDAAHPFDVDLFNELFT